MTKQEIITALESIIGQYGFTTVYYRNDWLPTVKQELNDYCGITIHEEVGYDELDRRIYTDITAQARVCCMNPNATTDELRSAADQILRGAELADKINAMHLRYNIH